jgi:hypothetical protein
MTMAKKRASAATTEPSSEVHPVAQALPNPDGYFSTPSRARAMGCLAQMAVIYREILSNELAREVRLPERIDWLEDAIQELMAQGRDLRADDATQIFEIYADYKRMLQL